MASRKNFFGVVILAGFVGLVVAIIFQPYFRDYYFMSPGLCSDMVRANLPTYYLLFDSITQEGNFWSWKMGIGTSMFSHADVVCDPFTYIVFLLGRKGIPTMMVFSLIVKVLAEALCFYGYLSVFELKKESRILAALVYAFCGYSLIMGLNYALGTILVYAPLVLWGIEELIKKNKSILLGGALFAVCIYSYYYFYTIGVISACYLIIRSVQQGEKWWKNLARLVGIGIGTILLSGFILFPQIELVLASPRVNEGTDVKFGVDLFIPDFATFCTAIVRSIGNDILGDGIKTSYLGSNYSTSNADYFQTGTYTSIITFILLWYYIRRTKSRKNLFIWIAVFCTVLLIPAFSFVMNMFSTINTRWMFIVSLAECVLIAVAIDLLLREETICLQYLLEGVVITGLLYLGCSAVCLYAAGVNLYGIENFKNVYAVYILKNKSFIVHAVAIIGLFVVFCFICSRKKKGIVSHLCCICVALLIVWDVSFNYQTWLSVKESDKQYTTSSNVPYEDASANAIRELWELDDGLYRVHKNFDSVYDFNGIASENDSMVQNYYGITCYNSLNNSQYIEFLQTMGIYVCLPQSRDYFASNGIAPEMVTGAQLNYISGVENDEDLLDYLGVKYFLNRGEAIPLDDKWEIINQYEDVVVYENKDVFPIAFINGKMMDKQSFLELGYSERKKAILEYTIVDEMGAQNYDESTKKESNCVVISHSQDRVELIVDNNYSSEKILSFSIPYDRNWNVYVDGQKTDSSKVNISLLGVEVGPGKHNVTLKYIPTSFILGSITSVLSLATCAFLLIKKKRTEKLCEIEKNC